MSLFDGRPSGTFSHANTRDDIIRATASAGLPSGGPQGYQDWRAEIIRERIKAAKAADAAEAAKGKGRRKKTRGGKKKKTKRTAYSTPRRT